MDEFCTITHNGLGLCEVAENRSRKFLFRRNVAKANFYLLIYEKKPIKLAFADYEAQTFNLDFTPPFCKTLVSGSTIFRFSFGYQVYIAFGNFRLMFFLLRAKVLCGRLPFLKVQNVLRILYKFLFVVRRLHVFGCL